MLYKLDEDVQNMISDFFKGNGKMTESLNKIYEVIDILETDVWQGKSKESAISLMKILKEYHEKLKIVAEYNTNAKIDLHSNAEDYMKSGSMPSLWK